MRKQETSLADAEVQAAAARRVAPALPRVTLAVASTQRLPAAASRRRWRRLGSSRRARAAGPPGACPAGPPAGECSVRVPEPARADLHPQSSACFSLSWKSCCWLRVLQYVFRCLTLGFHSRELQPRALSWSPFCETRPTRAACG